MSNKEKRLHSLSGEANNSFVKNVTSRVSGLLPATIAKWFSSPSSSNANGSTQTADATDSSTEDEAPESLIASQPPSKRMRFSSSNEFNHYVPIDTSCGNTNIEALEPCNPYNTIQSPPGRSTFRRETNFVSTPLRPPDEESAIDRTGQKDISMFKSQHTVSTIGPSVATKRKSLFDSPSSGEASMRACAKTSSNTMRDPHQPCFKPSLLGSPFYPGRTMYGGAAASYINQPNIKHRLNTLVNESSSNDNTISHSTKRIMDLLEHYSSPLNEAKRIPQYVRTANKTPNTSFEGSSPYTNKVLSYKTQELHVPSIASVLRLKQRSRLMDTTNVARQLMASHSSTSDYLPYPSLNTQRDQMEKESGNKLTTKVKSRLTRTKRGDNSDLETNLPAPVNLPSAVLQIDQNKLPNFSFGTPIVTQSFSSTPKPTSFTMTGTSAQVSVTKTTTEITETPLCKLETVSSMNPYKFSSPVRISCDSSHASTTPPKFTFGSPERSIDKPKVSEKKDDDPSCVVGTPTETQIKVLTSNSKDWQCPDCWVSNKADIEKCVCCEGQKPSLSSKIEAKCSMCKLADSQSHIDKCVNCEKIKVNSISNSKPLASKNQQSRKWKCEDCWVNNDESAESCACCGGRHPEKSIATEKKGTLNYDESDWKCEACWVKNQSKSDKCVACSGAKPGSAVASSSTFPTPAPKPPDNAFKIALKAQSDKWECSNCLVRNDSDKSKCVCCETERAGATKETEKKTFNFGMNSSFKFGIDPNAKETNIAKPLETNATSEAKFEESETNNNVLAKTPTFSFGEPAKKPKDQIDAPTNVVDKPPAAPAMNFKFGIPSSTSTAPAVAAVFGTPNKLPVSASATVTEEKEKPQMVPKVTFAMPTPAAQEVSAPVPNLFALPTAAKNGEDKHLSTNTTETPSSLKSSQVVEKKEIPSNHIMAQPIGIASTTPQQNSFSFSGTGAKIQSNLFSSPATTAATSSLFSSPLQSTPVTNTVSMFQKSEPTSTSTMSMFQNSDPTNTNVTLFQKSETKVPAAPMFGFGTNAPSQPQPEKSKFNFTFGSGNNSETTSLFQPTFGAPAENANSSKFPLSSGNTIGAVNALSANALGSGNKLSVGNPLTSNALSSTELSTNALGGAGGELSINPLSNASSLQPASQPAASIFGAPAQKENMWSSTNNNNTPSNLFVSSSTSNNMQKSTFTFGSSTSFNASSATPVFGATQPTSTPTFGSAVQPVSTPAFGSAVQPASTPAFGNAVQPTSTPAFGSALQPTSTPAFGSAVQPTSTPAFGSAVQPSSTPAFGSAVQLTSAPAFGSNAQSTLAPAFGSAAQSTQNMFGMTQNPSNQPSVFSSPVQNLFGSPQPANNLASAPSIFGTPSVGATPAFGAANASAAPFEAPSLTPSQAPAFNFGGAPPSTRIFGFGQQPQQQPQQQLQQQPQQQPQQTPNIYSFGGAQNSSQQVQFNMGSAPAQRRVRKAFRRNTPR